MTDATAFIAAIHAAPDDAAPRLVFADWLEENGDTERADLIRRMCRVPSYLFTWSRHVHAESVGAIRGLRSRVEAIYRDEWDRLPGVELIQVTRGLIEYIAIQPLPFLAHAGDIFARHPVRDVRLVSFLLRESRRPDRRGRSQTGTCDRPGPAVSSPACPT